MKVFDIALKDMLRYFRSTFAVGMMLVVPLLITGLIYFAFGGVLQSSETAAYTLPVIKLQIVNLDQGDAQTNLNMGGELVKALSDESVKNVFAVTQSSEEISARTAVDKQEAALALIVPANFTQAALTGSEKAQVAVYQDPTLSFGPGITREVVGQFLDALSGGQIAVNTTLSQFKSRGQAADPAMLQQVQAQYGDWFKLMASEKTWNLPVVKRLPNKETPKSIGDHRTTLMGPVMAGMLIFFVFFTGANTAQSILKEQEEGTLARIFTTPTPLSSILGGKFTAVFMTLIIQSLVLIAASAVAFKIEWGDPLTLTLVVLGLVVAAAGFGIFVMSFVKSTQQGGTVIGGVLTVTGMVGGLFSTGVTGLPSIMDQASLSMPQGWALRAMKLSLSGAHPQEALVPVLVLLVFGIIFFTLGNRMFRSRFA